MTAQTAEKLIFCLVVLGSISALVLLIASGSFSQQSNMKDQLQKLSKYTKHLDYIMQYINDVYQMLDTSICFFISCHE